MRRRVHSAVLIAAVLLVSACAHQPMVHPPVQVDSMTGDRSVLAGEWEYEDGATVTLRLDEQGNGIYSYKEGRFETLQLEKHTWVGKWYQQENDREGGFTVKLSEDYTEGEGRWWYARIGTDHAPTQKGGTFRLSKRTSLTKLNETPSLP
jgi:hypothetical protein